jgi:Leucine-rich repeat (LRR) protein
MATTVYSVLGTQYFVLSTRRTALPALFLCCFLTSGCGPTNLGPAVTEPTLADQLAAVHSGASDAIHISARPLSETELASIAEAKALKRLTLDRADTIATPQTLERLTALPQLEMFWFRGRGIDDNALAQIAKTQTLRILNLPHGEFTDAGLANLKQLPNLVQLRFGSPQVTDAGIASLAEFPALLRLHLIDVPITGAGLKSLAKIENLESLYIDGGNFTDADVDALFQARPKLHVHFNQQHHDRDPHAHAH